MFLETRPQRPQPKEWVETPTFRERNISSSDTSRFEKTTPILREADERLEIMSFSQRTTESQKLSDAFTIKCSKLWQNSKQRLGFAGEEDGVLRLVPVDAVRVHSDH